jgi:uncharacterized protein (TIGR02996 family)
LIHNLSAVLTPREEPMPPKPKPAIPNPAAALPGEADILASVIADLSDDTAKLVYADWLEDRDDSRGPFLRKALAAVRAGEKLPTVKFAPQPWCDLVGLTLLRSIHVSDLAAHADKILRLARPGLAFRSTRAADAKLPVGASKFGGGPDLPPDAEWPVLHEEPLAFVAQFNLAHLSASLACRELPDSGLLSVFCAWDPDGANCDFSEKGSWRLLYFPEASKLARRLPPLNSFRPCRLTFAETVTLPDQNSPWKRELGLGRDEDAWMAYQMGVAECDLEHRLLGYPPPVQSAAHLKKTVRHLMTIESDDNPSWAWGERAALHFTIGEDHLKARRFDRARLEVV